MNDLSRRDWIALGAILFLALLLRLGTLNAPLWYDELTTVQTHLKLGWGEMLQSYSMNHHYLHNIAAKASMAAFGPAPWAIRLPALLFGLGGIAAMWVLARDVAGRLPAHATALLLALSYHHIWFSTNARGYTGMALFGTLALIWFLRGLASGKQRHWLLFAAMMAATIFTHLTGAFFFVGLGLVWLALLLVRAWQARLRRTDITGPFSGFALGGFVTLLLYLPLLPSLLLTVSTVSESSAVDPMKEYQNPLWTVAEGVRTAIGQTGPVMLIAGLGALTLILLGSVSLRRRAPLYGWIVAAHIGVTVLVLMAVGMRIWPRFFFADIPLLMLLIVLGVLQICTLLGRFLPPPLARGLFPAALLVMSLLSAGLAARNYAAPKQDLAGAFAITEAERQADERVYAISYAGEVFTGYFGADWVTIWTEADYREALATPGPLTIVVAFPGRNLREYPQMADDLQSGILTLRTDLPGTLGDGDILILHRN
ncbi:MAG: glycosyltransferase family 39 protein [Paracoccaceae bacterium]